MFEKHIKGYNPYKTLLALMSAILVFTIITTATAKATVYNVGGEQYTDSGFVGKIYTVSFIATANETINTLGIKISTPAGNGRLALYDQNGLLAQSSEFALASGWNNHTIPSVNVVTDQTYRIAVQVDSSNAVLYNSHTQSWVTAYTYSAFITTTFYDSWNYAPRMVAYYEAPDSVTTGLINFYNIPSNYPGCSRTSFIQTTDTQVAKDLGLISPTGSITQSEENGVISSFIDNPCSSYTINKANTTQHLFITAIATSAPAKYTLLAPNGNNYTVYDINTISSVSYAYNISDLRAYGYGDYTAKIFDSSGTLRHSAIYTIIPNDVTINIASNLHGSIVTSAYGYSAIVRTQMIVPYGTAVTFEAFPDTGYTFVRFDFDNGVYTTINPYTISDQVMVMNVSGVYSTGVPTPTPTPNNTLNPDTSTHIIGFMVIGNGSLKTYLNGVNERIATKNNEVNQTGIVGDVITVNPIADAGNRFVEICDIPATQCLSSLPTNYHINSSHPIAWVANFVSNSLPPSNPSGNWSLDAQVNLNAGRMNMYACTGYSSTYGRVSVYSPNGSEYFHWNLASNICESMALDLYSMVFDANAGTWNITLYDSSNPSVIIKHATVNIDNSLYTSPSPSPTQTGNQNNGNGLGIPSGNQIVGYFSGFDSILTSCVSLIITLIIFIYVAYKFKETSWGYIPAIMAGFMTILTFFLIGMLKLWIIVSIIIVLICIAFIKSQYGGTTS